MMLSEIILGTGPLDITGDTGVDIAGLAYDSRKVGRGDLFFALHGEHADGHAFIGKAIEAGAVAVVYDNPAGPCDKNTGAGGRPDTGKGQQGGPCRLLEQFFRPAFGISAGNRNHRDKRKDNNDLSDKVHSRGMGTEGGSHRDDTIYDQR